MTETTGYRPGTLLVCTRTERTAWLVVGRTYVVAEPIKDYHEHPQVIEFGCVERVDMAYGEFQLAAQPDPIHIIAAMLDYPRVNRHGPSRRSIHRAERIWNALKIKGYVVNI